MRKYWKTILALFLSIGVPVIIWASTTTFDNVVVNGTLTAAHQNIDASQVGGFGNPGALFTDTGSAWTGVVPNGDVVACGTPGTLCMAGFFGLPFSGPAPSPSKTGQTVASDGLGNAIAWQITTDPGTTAGDMLYLSAVGNPNTYARLASGTVGTFLAGPGAGQPPAYRALSGTDLASNLYGLLYLGDGSDGAATCSGNTSGAHQYTNFTIAVSTTCTASVQGLPLFIMATGTCTIAGTLDASGAATGNLGTLTGGGGGSGAGGGGGTAAGHVGLASQGGSAIVYGSAGSAGAASGGTGGNGSAPTVSAQTMAYRRLDPLSGANGGDGGSSGGAGGKGGLGVIMVCHTINFTGTINASGQNGGASVGNNTGGAGGGGGAGVVMAAYSYTANSGTINTAGGLGGSCGAFTGCGVGGIGGAGWSKQITLN